jgi:hypothetical protein
MDSDDQTAPHSYCKTDNFINALFHHFCRVFITPTNTITLRACNSDNKTPHTSWKLYGSLRKPFPNVHNHPKPYTCTRQDYHGIVPKAPSFKNNRLDLNHIQMISRLLAMNIETTVNFGSFE